MAFSASVCIRKSMVVSTITSSVTSSDQIGQLFHHPVTNVIERAGAVAGNCINALGQGQFALLWRDEAFSLHGSQNQLGACPCRFGMLVGCKAGRGFEQACNGGRLRKGQHGGRLVIIGSCGCIHANGARAEIDPG